MKKLLVPFFLILSTGFASAGGWFGGNNFPTTSSSVGIRQVVDGATGSIAVNNAQVGQLALGIGDANATARTNVRQGIFDVNNSIAVNNAEVTNIAVGINP